MDSRSIHNQPKPVFIETASVVTDGPSPRLQTEKSSFLDLFYDDYIEQLVATLVAGCKTGKDAEDVVTKHVVGRPMGSKAAIPVKLPVEESLITAETLNHICELLTFCVQHHSFRIK